MTRISLAVVLFAFVHEATASPLFADESVLEFSLSGPLSTLMDNKEDKAELPFVLRVDDVEYPVRVRVRGKSRTRVCDFPPLRLNVSGMESGDSVFAGQGKLKLVTHCRDKTSTQVDMLEEYATYRIFNLLSDVSYKVRLVEITYYDTDDRMKETTFARNGFLIESAAELADRIGGQPVEETGVSMNSLDTEQAALVFVFQYMIGNTDWSLVLAEGDDACCHNIDLFDIGELRYPVPYDFDLSGLENAPYAKPDPSIGNRNVRERRYRGYCLESGAVTDAIQFIASRENDILSVLPQVPGLSQKNADAGNKYLAGFFKKARKPEKLGRTFERRCL